MNMQAEQDQEVEGRKTIAPGIGARIGKWCETRRQMEDDFIVARALRAGTQAMRAMGSVFLPLDSREMQNPADYAKRLLRTFLTPGYQDGVETLAARPFQRPVKITGLETLPESLQKLEADADRRGTNLTRFSRATFDAGIDRGVVHILVDHPGARIPGTPDDLAKPDLKPAQDESGKVTRNRTHAEDLDADIRPYFRRITADRLIDWAFRTDPVTELEVLAMVQVYERSSNFDPVTRERKVVDVIHMWTETEWQRWERAVPVQIESSSSLTAVDPEVVMNVSTVVNLNAITSQGSEQRPYFMVKSGTNPLGEIPLVTIPISTVGDNPFFGRPMLIGCAQKNLEHWQVSSWRASVMYACGSPILTMAGLPKDELDKKTVVGYGAVVKSDSDKLSVSYAEPSGESTTALKERDGELVGAMTTLALAPLIRTAGPQPTATKESVDEKQTTSKAQQAVEATEWGLYEAFLFAAKWDAAVTGQDPAAVTKLPDEFEIAIFRDFGLSSRAATDLATIEAARARGDISLETYLNELIERGVLVSIDSIEDEMDRVDEEQTAKLDAMMASSPFGPEGADPNGDPNADPNADPKKPPPFAKKGPKGGKFGGASGQAGAQK